jgi:hypothetical protein
MAGRGGPRRSRNVLQGCESYGELCRGSPRRGSSCLVAVVRAEVGMCCKVVSSMVNSVAVVRA